MPHELARTTTAFLLSHLAHHLPTRDLVGAPVLVHSHVKNAFCSTLYTPCCAHTYWIRMLRSATARMHIPGSRDLIGDPLLFLWWGPWGLRLHSYPNIFGSSSAPSHVAFYLTDAHQATINLQVEGAGDVASKPQSRESVSIEATQELSQRPDSGLP